MYMWPALSLRVFKKRWSYTDIHAMAMNHVKKIHISSRTMGIKEWVFGSQTSKNTEKEGITSPTNHLREEPTENPTIKDAKAHLQSLALSMSDRPNSTVNSVHWTELQFTDMNMKVKTLLNCEKAFGRHVPNRALNGIETFGDLLKFYDTPVTNKQRPGTLFPNIRENLSTLPVNLSIEFPPKRRENPQRVPFQNFNDPRHKTFPNKKQKLYK